MRTVAEILSQGEEVVGGQTVDSNAAWLSQQLWQMGLQVRRHTTVGDHLGDLVAVLREIAERADCCLCTGGLGPTSDDLTAEAVAQAFGLPLEFDPEAYRQVQQFFARRQREMPPSNRKQAYFPQGALRLDNACGSAPGFALRAGCCWFAFAPGVPSEMRDMFATHIKPLLLKNFEVRPSRLASLHSIGIGESALQQKIAAMALPEAVQLGFCAGDDDVQTKLLFPHDYPEAAMRELVADAVSHIGEAVYGLAWDGQAYNIAQALEPLLHGRRLAVIETASHGLIAAKCAGRNWLSEALVATCEQRLCARFGLPWTDSEPRYIIAERLAQALLRHSAADWALVQLSAGDLAEGDNLRLFHALAYADAICSGEASIGGGAQRKQNQAAMLALDFLRRQLQRGARR